MIEALTRLNLDPPISILALTRNPSSPASRSLASKPNVELLKGDLSDCSAIFASTSASGLITAVFSVQVPDMRRKGGADQEVTQGCALIDAALAHGVRHFVYSSVDRGGANSDNNPTVVPHFASKHHVEQHLKTAIATQSAASDSKNTMTYTILRPTAFMDNLQPGIFSYMFGAMWETVDPKPLQLVSTASIGVFGASALLHPNKAEYHNRALTLVGDELTQKDADAVFQKVVGRPMPRTYRLVINMLLWAIGEIGAMVAWFRDTGYGGSVEECRRCEPGVQNFEQWLKESSGFRK